MKLLRGSLPEKSPEELEESQEVIFAAITVGVCFIIGLIILIIGARI